MHKVKAYDYSKYNKERLPSFAQVDLRIDKTFYLKHCMLGFYLDLQNITVKQTETAGCIDEHSVSLKIRKLLPTANTIK